MVRRRVVSVSGDRAPKQEIEMGDRVLVTFTDDGKEFTPAIYMHWSGHRAPAMIQAAQPLMRAGDAGYAAARFCGYCHAQLGDDTCGLGLISAPDGKDWDEYSHGDAGVYIVNVKSGDVVCHGGYGKGFKMDPEKFGR